MQMQQYHVIFQFVQYGFYQNQQKLINMFRFDIISVLTYTHIYAPDCSYSVHCVFRHLLLVHYRTPQGTLSWRQFYIAPRCKFVANMIDQTLSRVLAYLSVGSAC